MIFSRRFAVVALLVCSFGASACDTASLTDGPPDLPPDLLQRDASPVQTDSLEYRLQKVSGGYEAFATAVYVNRTGGPVYYERCTSESTGPMFGLRRSGRDSTTRSTIGGAWACVGGVPSGVLPAGDELRVRVWLGSTDSPYANPPIQPSERVGRFRIELALCSLPSNEGCAPLPQSARQSNAFDVRFEP